MTQAFEGIRIIDFSQVLAAPFASQQLAQLGADVIKVEQPGAGDQTRGLMDGGGTGMSPSFLTCNLGKRSITVNLKAPRAAEVIHPLVASADAVVENSRPGVMKRLGFDYEALRAVKPDLVYCSVTGYGQSGPNGTQAAYDGAIQAASGMMAITGHPETGPVRTGYMPVDLHTAMNAAFALAAGLYRRLATGAGQYIDVAMMDSAMVLQAPQVSAYCVQGVVPPLYGNRSPTRAPTANVFVTADGRIQIIALKHNQVEAFFGMLGRPDLLTDARFASAAARIEHTAELEAIMTPLFAAETTATWKQRATDAGLPVAEIRSYPEVVADPQFDGRNAFVEVPSPRDPGTTVKVVGAAYVTSDDGPATPVPPPRLGEHTDEVLAELGFDARTIEGLRADGVV